ncbi:ABC transporter ATP-binding protein/permease [Sphingobacterium sp. HMA12]|uniref:ABC transporter ATP-binding protein/permease n=1 Tax=Sphingobacterium sp. HMA12 TaxID=2050894 RepID=UPI000CEA1B53|nr:ABC transporter ATP-binding protein/permease [Sphingobacterium sp. HMA12]
MQKKNIDMELSLTDDIDMHLIPDSIYNNIKVGNPLASKLDVIYAAEKAMVLDFAWEFPKGLDTFVDDERHPLSVEQKQQINLARIYLKNAQTTSYDADISNSDIF